MIAVGFRAALVHSLSSQDAEPEGERMSDEDFLRSIAKVEAAAR